MGIERNLDMTLVIRDQFGHEVTLSATTFSVPDGEDPETTGERLYDHWKQMRWEYRNKLPHKVEDLLRLARTTEEKVDGKEEASCTGMAGS